MAYRVLFCGTPAFALPSLEFLHKSLDFEICGVVSQPDRPAGRGKKLQASPVKSKALELGYKVWTPESINSEMELWKSLNCDVAVVIAYGQILKQEFIDLFPSGAFNLHGSLLPRWRGAAPIQRAIMEGDNETGLCLQKIVRKLDAGDVVAEQKMSLPMNMNAIQLHNEMSELGPGLLEEPFLNFLRGQSEAVVQNESLVNYAHKITKEEGLLDWSKSAESLHNRIRGLAMGPQAYGMVNNKKFKIHESRRELTEHEPLSLNAKKHANNGEVLGLNEAGDLAVKCGEGVIYLSVIQPPSKQKMKAKDLVNGGYLKQGDTFHGN